MSFRLELGIRVVDHVGAFYRPFFSGDFGAVYAPVLYIPCGKKRRARGTSHWLAEPASKDAVVQVPEVMPSPA